MRRVERQKLAAEKAKAIMDSRDYEIILQAMFEKMPVLFEYIDRFGVDSRYYLEYPHSFFFIPEHEEKIHGGTMPERVFLWSGHVFHNEKEQYDVERLWNVRMMGGLMDAIVDPSVHFYFWGGKIRPDVIKGLPEWKTEYEI